MMGDDDPDAKRAKDHPFGVIDGGRGDEKTRPPTVHTEIPFGDDVKMVLRGSSEVWVITDPGRWANTPLSAMPAMVAYVTLGLGKPRGALTPGQAADVIASALERADELTPRRERALGRIPKDSSGFDVPGLPVTASLEFWWARWWPGLA